MTIHDKDALSQLWQMQWKLMKMTQPSVIRYLGVSGGKENLFRLRARETILTSDTELQLTELTKENILALEDELHEVLGCLNWKPWRRTKKKIDVEHLREELIDCLHFMIELMMIWGLNPRTVLETYSRKHEINLKRQSGGY